MFDSANEKYQKKYIGENIVHTLLVLRNQH